MYSNLVFLLAIIAGLLSVYLTNGFSLLVPKEDHNIPLIPTPDIADWSNHNETLEVVDSYYLYIKNIEEINSILDQLEDIFDDFQIKDMRKWFKREMETVGYILRMPVIKGEEHRYTPLLERYGKPDLTQMQQIYKIKHDEIEPATPNLPNTLPSLMSKVRTHAREDVGPIINPPGSVLISSLLTPHKGKIRIHTKNGDEEKLRKQVPEVLQQPLPIVTTESPKMIYAREDDDVGLHTYPIPVSTASVRFTQPQILLNELGLPTYHPVSVDVDHDHDLAPTTAVPVQPMRKMEKEEAILPDSIFANTFGKLRYSVEQVYQLFPHIVRIIGYMDSRDCIRRVPSNSDFATNVNLPNWVNVMRNVEAEHREVMKDMPVLVFGDSDYTGFE